MKLIKFICLGLFLSSCATERLLTQKEIEDSCSSAESRYQSAKANYDRMEERVSSSFTSKYGSIATTQNIGAIDQAARDIAYSDEAQEKNRAEKSYEWWCLEATPGTKILDKGNTLEVLEKASGEPQRKPYSF